MKLSYLSRINTAKGVHVTTVVERGLRASGMKAIEMARRLHRDASMVSRLWAEYEAVRNPKTEQMIAGVLDKQLTTDSAEKPPVHENSG